jgi:hypothetical protein
MKAITVTQELKDANQPLFNNNRVGSIKQLKEIPKSFVSLNYNTGQLTQGYHKLETSIHELDGFYSVVTPSFDKETEKLGTLFFDVTVFTYPIIPLSAEELEDKAKEDDKEAERLLRTVVWEGKTKDGSYYLLTMKDDGKLESIKIP